jgi:hypothetical protein
LSAEEAEVLEGLCGCGLAVELDVIADCVGVEEAVDAASGDELFGDDAVEELLAVGEDLSRLFAVAFVFEDAWVDSLQAPGVKERRPVDVVAEYREWLIFDHADAGELGCGEIFCAPFDGCAPGARFLDGDCDLLGCGVARAKGFVVGAMLCFELGTVVGAEEAGGDGNGAAGVADVHDGLAIVRGDFDGGVGAAGGSSTDEERDFEVLALHLAGDVHHFVE